MIAIVGNKDRKEIRTLRGSLLLSGYPAAAVLPINVEQLSASLAAVAFDGASVPSSVDPERVVFADGAAFLSGTPGVALTEAERIKGRIEEVLEIKNGVRFDNFISKLYSERNGVSVFLGETIPLTLRERLIIRLLSVYPGRFLTAREIAVSCFPETVSDGAVRTAIYEINRKAKDFTGFSLIQTKPNEGYSFGG